jgi:hypothetical protein
VRSLLGGSLLLPGILGELLGARAAQAAPHHAPRARRLIFLYMHGGVSQMESFDPKPRLAADHGKTVAPEGHGRRPGKLLGPLWGFKRYGRCGAEVSDLFPHVGAHADDLCIIRSLKTDSSDHTEAALGLHTGSFGVPRPSLGAWVSFGLGTENRNLPSFVVITPPKPPWGGNWLWGSDFLPADHQATRIIPGGEPLPHLRPAAAPELQELELGLVDAINRRHLEPRGADPGLRARLKSFETAFHMQREAPEAFDLGDESDATLALYGLERGQTEGFAWQCLLARRLAERGVRFIELIDRGAGTDGSNWDAHKGMATHANHARNVDRPIAALLTDLASRGMLEETLVVWTTEFGRTPTSDGESPTGRGHNNKAFSSWMAGGGVKAGLTYGATDEHGGVAVDRPVHVHDFHATILHLLGIDHKRLTFRHAGRDFRLTDVHGRVVTDLIA